MTCYSSRSNATKTCSGYEYNGTCYANRSNASPNCASGYYAWCYQSPCLCEGYVYSGGNQYVDRRKPNSYSCSSGVNGNNGYCYLTEKTYDYSCSSGTSGNDGYCYKSSSSPNITYSCSSGILSGTKCIS